MKSLYVKFVVVTIGIMFLSGILAFFISNTYYQQKLKPFNDQKNTKIALDIAVFVENHPDVNLNEYLENISAIGYQIYLVDPLGKESYFGAPFRDNSLPSSTKQYVLNGDIYHGILHFPEHTFVTGFFANELKNSIGIPLTHNGKDFALFLRPDIKLLFNEMHLLFGWLLTLAITLSIVMVVFSTKYLVKPISRLTNATKSLANGNFNVVLDINRRDELGELSHSFLQMAKKLEQMDEMRKEFISNISHDIQSPLSNIKGYTNLLDNESMSLEERSQYVSIINGEIKRLSTLTKQLLLLASLDRNNELMVKKRFNVDQQIKELIRNYQWLISEKEIMISYTLPETSILGDPSLLNTIWDNLLSNAIKYNKPQGNIDISIVESKESIKVTFKDTGIGLDKTELGRIFERFYRADRARTRTIEGTGLGLSIVDTIVKLHDGNIIVHSKAEEGTTFVVELPVR
ncbi:MULTISPECIES: cell wall metabolism sensor histidine kinase WalK [unclassified Bacillus (in: firmicutes)]|uniref:sensor histidine kinase n=1 Tax=unclassified Bacillus (in: firmicutes) TaxID=185979 RepID=UPI0008E11F53|nr:MULTISPECIES: HAMP domain-containing sensor histidine kinase [unclassified Bacillus (in: firmicutes)]SFA87216.1 Signal transduction histidine kinase [Bacillus sp. UNCCL13]SFQ84129.1 Signal transduction histidine kinase [Bacillus sp. cl95]